MADFVPSPVKTFVPSPVDDGKQFYDDTYIGELGEGVVSGHHRHWRRTRGPWCSWAWILLQIQTTGTKSPRRRKLPVMRWALIQKAYLVKARR